MKTSGRIAALSIAFFALIGEINRFINFGAEYASVFFFGFSDSSLLLRLAFPLTIFVGIALVAAGIYCSVAYDSPNIKSLKVIASLALATFIAKPFIWIAYGIIDYGSFSMSEVGTELKAWWFHFDVSETRNLVGSSIGGILLFITVITNFILALISKPAHTQQQYAAPQNFQQPYAQQPVYQQPQYVQPPQPPVQESMTAQLAELERMFESGALTKTEFTAAKKRVLGS